MARETTRGYIAKLLLIFLVCSFYCFLLEQIDRLISCIYNVTRPLQNPF